MAPTARQRIAQTIAVLACLLLLPAMAATWVAAVATNTNDYVRTVGPLARDKAITDAVAARLGQVVVDKVMEAKPASVKAPQFRETVEPLVTAAVAKVISSEEFASFWEEANRRLHRAVVKVLETNQAVQEQLDIDLTALVQDVIDDVADELGLSSAVLAPQFTYEMLDADQVAKAREIYQLLDKLGYWLPIAWLVLVALALAVGSRRARVGSTLALGSAIVLALTAAAVLVGKRLAVDQVPAEDQAVARAVIDQLTQQLVLAIWIGLAVALVVWVALKFVPRSRVAA